MYRDLILSKLISVCPGPSAHAKRLASSPKWQDKNAVDFKAPAGMQGTDLSDMIDAAHFMVLHLLWSMHILQQLYAVDAPLLGACAHAHEHSLESANGTASH
jgi:hypothetical protein